MLSKLSRSNKLQSNVYFNNEYITDGYYVDAKVIGSTFYIHRSAEWCLPQKLAEKVFELDNLFFKYKWGDACNIIKYDVKTDNASIIYSENFDREDFPTIDKVYVIKNKELSRIIDYTKRDVDNKQVYHHKWMMVSREYKGFNVRRSELLSDWWTQHPIIVKKMKEIPMFKSRIGYYGYWKQVLEEMQQYDIKNDTGFEIVPKMIHGVMQYYNKNIGNGCTNES
jgi:hypothetical protein